MGQIGQKSDIASSDDAMRLPPISLGFGSECIVSGGSTVSMSIGILFDVPHHLQSSAFPPVSIQTLRVVNIKEILLQLSLKPYINRLSKTKTYSLSYKIA